MIQQSSFQKSRAYFHFSAKFSDAILPPKELEPLWQELAIKLKKHRYLQIHACVLLSNHFHLLASVNELYFGFVKENLSYEFSNWRESRNVEVPFLRQIHSLADYRQVYRYIYRNPVEARLSNFVQDYRFSTLFEMMGAESKFFFANDNMGLMINPIRILRWIQSEDLFFR